ncbi:tail fiber domain-containing protein [Pseudovibrio ascidiaceicola]|uniref:tail fiber domain-containing protein n=1 Tax=Pseudovibrio ascidiaceicola TaxID=285279 RepID=UPI003D36F0B2
MSTTPNLGLPLLDGSVNVSEDWEKINQFSIMLDQKVGEILTTLADVATNDHQHGMDKIAGLITALSGKAAADHAHSLNDLSDVDVTDASDGKVLQVIAGGWGLGEIGVTSTEIAGQLAQKANVNHTHSTGDISGLQTVLNDARDAAVAAVMGGVTPAQLDTLRELAEALQDADSEIAAIISSLAGKANTSHSHLISNVSGLQTALNGKAASSHNHNVLKSGSSTKVKADSSGAKITGRLEASGDIAAYSDARLKSELEPIPNALATVIALQGWLYSKDGKRSMGLIAQQVEPLVPEVVYAGDVYSLAYGNLVALLIEAIKELNARLDKVEGS